MQGYLPQRLKPTSLNGASLDARLEGVLHPSFDSNLEAGPPFPDAGSGPYAFRCLYSSNASRYRSMSSFRR
jgi:hypothetical protein